MWFFSSPDFLCCPSLTVFYECWTWWSNGAYLSMQILISLQSFTWQNSVSQIKYVLSKNISIFSTLTLRAFQTVSTTYRAQHTFCFLKSSTIYCHKPHIEVNVKKKKKKTIYSLKCMCTIFCISFHAKQILTHCLLHLWKTFFSANITEVWMKISWQMAIYVSFYR